MLLKLVFDLSTKLLKIKHSTNPFQRFSGYDMFNEKFFKLK